MERGEEEKIMTYGKSEKRTTRSERKWRKKREEERDKDRQKERKKETKR